MSTTEPSGCDICPIDGSRLGAITDLFDSNSATRGCWCMWFISSNAEVHAGWGNGNRARFSEMTHTSPTPMGLLAYDGDEAVGWCATGPRSRYRRAISPRATILRERNPSEDGDVWLVPCFFVRVGQRRAGITGDLLLAAADLARRHGAVAIEGFPLADDNPTRADEYYGREGLFARCGFTCVRRPTPRRAVMRLDLV